MIRGRGLKGVGSDDARPRGGISEEESALNPFEAVRNLTASQRLSPGGNATPGRSSPGESGELTKSRPMTHASGPAAKVGKPCAMLVLLALGLAAWASSRPGGQALPAQPTDSEFDAPRSLHGVQGREEGRRRRPSAASDHVHGRGDPRAWAAGAGAGGGALASPPLISSPPQGPAATTQAPRKGNGTRPAPVSAQGPRTGGAKTPAASPSVFTSDWAASRVAAGFADEFGTPAGRGRARGRVAVATRFWGTDAAATDRLDEFLGAAEQVGDIVLVGVRAEEDRVDTMGHLRRRNRSRTTGIAIQPWLGPAHTVNVLTEIAARLGAEFLLLWSVDVSLAPADAHCLLRLAAATDHAAAVVGGALPHHVFAEGTHKLLGAAAPWNTLSVWHVPTLVKTGFLLTSNGLIPGVGGSIEESLTASLLQFIQRHGTRSGGPGRRDAGLAAPGAPRVPTAAARAAGRATHWRHRAWLAKLPSVAWNVPGLSRKEASAEPAASTAELDARVARERPGAGSGSEHGGGRARRRARHWAKVGTKALRARQQHAWLGIPPGTVTHTAECAGGGDSG